MLALLDTADASRAQGNAHFKAKAYVQANDSYADALVALKQAAEMIENGYDGDAAAVKDAMHKCRLNRAAGLLKLQGYGGAMGEASVVIAEDPGNAKAHWRHGQACEALGDFPTAQASLVEAIKLNPSSREPRETLDALRARLKENPRLEQALSDLSLVEIRGLRSLNAAVTAARSTALRAPRLTVIVAAELTFASRCTFPLAGPGRVPQAAGALAQGRKGQ